MTTDQAASPAPTAYPQAHWKIERGDGDQLYLSISVSPVYAGITDEPASPSVGEIWISSRGRMVWNGEAWFLAEAPPLRLPMQEEELYALVHGADRVQAWAAATAEGTFTQTLATAEQVRTHLEVRGYVVISRDLETHTKMVRDTPWANWVEEVPAPPGNSGIAWFVDVFAADDPQFGQLCLVHGVQRVPSSYAGPEDPGGGA